MGGGKQQHIQHSASASISQGHVYKTIKNFELIIIFFLHYLQLFSVYCNSFIDFCHFGTPYVSLCRPFKPHIVKLVKKPDQAVIP